MLGTFCTSGACRDSLCLWFAVGSPADHSPLPASQRGRSVDAGVVICWHSQAQYGAGSQYVSRHFRTGISPVQFCLLSPNYSILSIPCFSSQVLHNSRSRKLVLVHRELLWIGFFSCRFYYERDLIPRLFVWYNCKAQAKNITYPNYEISWYSV